MNTLSCPICGRKVDWENKEDVPDLPFCSPKCRLIDLGRWLGESYKVPVHGDREESSAEEDIP